MLTNAQRDQFDRDGYVVVHDLLPPETLQAVRAEYETAMDRLYDGWHADGLVPPAGGHDFNAKLAAASAAGIDWFQPLDISLPFGGIGDSTPMHCGPAVFDMMRAPRILDVMEQLLGPEITSNPIQHVRIKPPPQHVAEGESRAHITATEWHQDRAVAMDEADRTDMITVWLAITDATLDNGCLQVLPGKHELLTHCPHPQARIGKDQASFDGAMPLPIPAGSAILFHPLTPHGSRANVSQSFRWSFDLRYQKTGQPTGREQFPEFVVRSAADPGSVLTDWRAWEAMWNDARHTLARSEITRFHRWDPNAEVCA